MGTVGVGINSRTSWSDVKVILRHISICRKITSTSHLQRDVWKIRCFPVCDLCRGSSEQVLDRTLWTPDVTYVMPERVQLTETPFLRCGLIKKYNPVVCVLTVLLESIG